MCTVPEQALLTFEILSLFPEYFFGPFDASIIGRARKKGIIQTVQHNIWSFIESPKERVDARPFGGGPGMVLTPGPCIRAIRAVKKEMSRVVYLSPQGPVLTMEKCQDLAALEHIVLLCGHYEGIDQRIIEKEVDEEISIGDYVLTNGCAAAVVLVDAVSRFLPGVMGCSESPYQDSFSNGIFEGPLYTRPVEFEGSCVPAVLRGGNHKAIAQWQREKAMEKTTRVRPDLIIGE